VPIKYISDIGKLPEYKDSVMTQPLSQISTWILIHCRLKGDST